MNSDDSPSEKCKIRPLHILNNVHQSGVNCLHASDIQDCHSSRGGFLLNIILSGGDDQALYYLRFELSLSATVTNNDFIPPHAAQNPLLDCLLTTLNTKRLSPNILTFF